MIFQYLDFTVLVSNYKFYESEIIWHTLTSSIFGLERHNKELSLSFI